MNPAALERVFGRSRLKMVTGQYVEVYREAAAPGERRRYTKRFLATEAGDFREWTEREWRILARLFGHGVRHVPDIVQYDRGAAGGDALVQTYDAGVTVDHWATLLPVQRDGQVQRHVFQDCAHWWALARHMLLALHEIHSLRLVHLDLKADNICLPLAPPDFDPAVRGQTLCPAFENLAFIDFAFSIVSGEAPTTPLPIGRQRTFRYQSPRLLEALSAGQDGDLEPTRRLDWRCDMYSLAALLQAFMPTPDDMAGVARLRGWTVALYREAEALLLGVHASHDGDAGDRLPHPALAEMCAAPLGTADLAGSLQRGWALADGIGEDDGATSDAMSTTAPLTRITMIEPQPVFTAVTALLPPPASAAIALPTDSPAPAAPAASPATPTPVPPSAASARADVEARRPATVYVLPVLAAVAALAWWLTRDPAASIDDPRPPGGSSAGVEIARPADPVASPAIAEAPRPPAPRATPPEVPPPAVVAPRVDAPPSSAAPVRSEPDAAREPVRERLARHAEQSFDDVVPRVVASAEPRIARVLSIAAEADDAADDRLTVTAAASVGDGAFAQVGSAPAATAPVQARRLNAAAQRAFYRQGSVVDAYELQRRAFDAHPADVEIAGNLAFYALKMEPPRAEESRRLAIYALALSTRTRRASRLEDWGNLAVASALTGRPDDARNAMLVLLSVSRDVNRSCHSALSSVASHGPSMRAPAEALLQRAQVRVDVSTAPQCRWPPKWRER